ncbi:MAG: T9SS type A sorting domain-containing protein [Bacteroidota bacterium]
MKRILLSLSAIAAFILPSQGQTSLQLTDAWAGTANNQTYDVWNDVTVTVMDFEFDAKNVGTASKKYMLKRQIISEVSGSDNYICWTLCFPPFVDVSTEAVTLAPNATYDLSSCHYRPFGNIGTTTIRYVVYDSLNVNDSAWFVINWHVTAVGIDEANAVNATVSAYPNPANASAVISYDLSGPVKTASIRLYNMLGSEVKEVRLNGNEGAITLNTAELLPGIYFYSIIVNEKVIATRKLTIAHQ